MRILIAENDVTSRAILLAVLVEQGHDVVATCDGAAAWEAMQRADAPRLLIIDWLMPELDGIEVCKKIRAKMSEQQPYILMLTSLNDEEHIVEGLEAGADDYVTKPFSPTELIARISVGERILASQERLIEQSTQLRDALEQVKTLSGFIPICCHCKRIRDDSDYWREVEEYVAANTEAEFSHSLCPDCVVKHYSHLKK